MTCSRDMTLSQKKKYIIFHSYLGAKWKKKSARNSKDRISGHGPAFEGSTMLLHIELQQINPPFRSFIVYWYCHSEENQSVSFLKTWVPDGIKRWEKSGKVKRELSRFRPSESCHIANVIQNKLVSYYWKSTLPVRPKLALLHLLIVFYGKVVGTTKIKTNQ